MVLMFNIPIGLLYVIIATLPQLVSKDITPN